MPDKRTCRDCVHFKYPEPSSLQGCALLTYYCPFDYINNSALGFAYDTMPACPHYEKKTQLTLF